MVGQRLYAVGGGWGTPLAFNEQYDGKVDAWSRIGTPMVGQWRNLGLAAVDNMLYAVGGWSGSYLRVQRSIPGADPPVAAVGDQGRVERNTPNTNTC